ncbi:MAG: hypothetical protein ABIE07_08580 [Candidatus Zixiibacteriota bacterium]
MLFPSECLNQNGTPHGEGSACTAVEACCFQDASCTNLDPLCCISLGGIPDGTGSVCLGDNNGNGWDDLCEPDELEACCLPDGICTMDLAYICLYYGGTLMGEGTSCSIRYTCCLPDGRCADLDPLCCLEKGGTPGDPGTFCLGDNNDNGIDDACEDEKPGVCCLSAGVSCILALADVCVGMGGTPQGAGTQCSELESCCFPDGSCENLQPLCCIEQGGTPFGPGTECPCEEAEACCLTDGSCVMEKPTNCTSQEGGQPQGNGTQCTSPEACCMPDGTCATIDPLCCEALNGNRQGVEAECLGDNNNDGIDDVCEEGFCQPGDADGSGIVDIGDISFLLNFLNGLGPPPVINNSDLNGDCIISVDDMVELTRSLFVTFTLPEGCQCDGVPVVDYSPMACCAHDGSCANSTDLYNFLSCIISDNIPGALGSVCAGDINDNSIDDYCEDGSEACCLPDGSCIRVLPAECESRGGTPKGFETICSEPEACCFPDGSCFDFNPFCCLERAGEPQGIGTVCLGDGCQYICGDANSDTRNNVGDAVFIINHVFKGGPAPDPIEACDSNCDSQCNVGDAVYIINHIFKGGPAPCAGCE